MVSLGSHANVYNTCLRILHNRQYRLWVSGGLDQDGCYPLDLQWYAEKNGEIFLADNPIELLGLTAVYEYVNPAGEMESYWWSVKGPDIQQALLDEAFPRAALEEPKNEGLPQTIQSSQKE